MYCTRCGRKLEEGEVCTCTQDQKNKKVQEKAPTQPSNENQKAVETAQEQSSKQAEWLQESGTRALKVIKEFLGKVVTDPKESQFQKQKGLQLKIRKQQACNLFW